MNNVRRKAIAGIQKQLAGMWRQIDGIMDDIDGLKCEEEEYKDNMPENMQSEERYETAIAACENLEEAYNMLKDAMDRIDAARDYLIGASVR